MKIASILALVFVAVFATACPKTDAPAAVTPVVEVGEPTIESTPAAPVGEGEGEVAGQ